MASLAKSLIVEMVGATEDRDTVKERLILAGADISHLKTGTAFINQDHDKKFDALLGRIIDAKKIYSESDCDTPSQLKAWTKLKRPFLWSRGEIWSGYGHAAADALASIYKFYSDRGEEPPIKWSVEGKTIERTADRRLTKTVIRGIAATISPCNKHTSTEVVEFLKSQQFEQSAIDSLMKTSTGDEPLYEVADNPLDRVCAAVSLATHLIRLAKHKK